PRARAVVKRPGCRSGHPLTVRACGACALMTPASPLRTVRARPEAPHRESPAIPDRAAEAPVWGDGIRGRMVPAPAGHTPAFRGHSKGKTALSPYTPGRMPVPGCPTRLMRARGAVTRAEGEGSVPRGQVHEDLVFLHQTHFRAGPFLDGICARGEILHFC